MPEDSKKLAVSDGQHNVDATTTPAEGRHGEDALCTTRELREDVKRATRLALQTSARHNAATFQAAMIQRSKQDKRLNDMVHANCATFTNRVTIRIELPM
ncbi:hypothetical protein BV20DRAFT_29546 [Pilatotrama ljubarskyi]|nr:hypothetical protein BV20DRAFT_29546 [Pilatotrama ljubarskyi]